MFVINLILTLILLIPFEGIAKPSYPNDIEKFINHMELCKHFQSEEPYDKERRIFLQKNIKNYCIKSEKEYFQIKKKYQKNKKLLEELEQIVNSEF